MGRLYEINVEVEGMEQDQFTDVMIELGWEELELYTYKDKVHYNGSGKLYGGMTEREAHTEIVNAIKETKPKGKVEIKTRWTNLDELPYNEIKETIGDKNGN